MKKGFTLAEVLITLAIIGVVAALTAPALISKFAAAQVGPKLAKAKSTLEIANENLMNEQEAEWLTRAFDDSSVDSEDYAKALQNFMKLKKFSSSISYKRGDGSSLSVSTITQTNIDALSALILGNAKGYLSSDGILYFFGSIESNKGLYGNGDNPHTARAGDVVVDINGSAGPNKLGKDVFGFYMYEDGSLEPYGAIGFGQNHAEDGSVTNEISTKANWKNGTSERCNDKEVVGSGLNCTGAVFDNNMKVTYKY